MEVFTLNNIRINSFRHIELKNALKKVLSEGNNPQIIITLNLDFLRIAENNTNFLHVCNNSLWNLPDGSGVTTLLKIKYTQKVERITGNDLFPMLLDIANQQLYKVALIGSSDTVLSKVKDLISKKYQKIAENLLCVSPPLNFEKDPGLNSKIINDVIDFKPDIVLAALGCPRQELWLWENMNRFESKINVGVGAVFDFYSGVKKRSPVLFQKIYMEWLWRLLNEPRRLFKRYIILDMPFFIKVSIRDLIHQDFFKIKCFDLVEINIFLKINFTNSILKFTELRKNTIIISVIFSSLLILLGHNFILQRELNSPNKYLTIRDDALEYKAMIEGDFDSIHSPLKYRILVPFLSSLLPFTPL